MKIDPSQVKKLAEIHCTMEEMANFFGCSVDTLERRFADVIAQARSSGKMSLRRKQFEVALSRNPQVLVWLGKIHLQQSEHSFTSSQEGGGFSFITTREKEVDLVS